MTIAYPNIDPIIFRFTDHFAVSWYSLSYVAGILLGLFYLKYLNKKCQTGFSEKFLDDLVTYAVFGIIIGGRLGYVLFYNFKAYMLHPLDIFKVWQGGMSFHGGAIGFCIAFYINCKLNKQSYFKLMDLVACVAPIGIFFGRIANFINGELYGRFTNSSLGMVFPDAGPFARHPSQIYEALSEGLLLFLVQFCLIHKTKIRTYPGFLSASFLLQYSLYRFVIEFFREPDAQLGLFGLFSMGQILSIPLFILSFIIIIYGTKHKQNI